jgi:general secretion pathway protein E
MNQLFAQVLTSQYGITASALLDAEKARDEKGGGSIGEVLIQKKHISETQLLEALSILYDIPYWPTLPAKNMACEFAQKLPIQFLKKYLMVPLLCQKQCDMEEGPEKTPAASEAVIDEDFFPYTIAINDPTNFQAFDDLVRILEVEDFQIVLSPKEEIIAAINLAYDTSRDSAEQLVQDMEETEESILSAIEETADLLDDTSDAPIIKLVNHVISQSIKARASDIHIEPYQDSFKIRYRVDGILYDLLTPPKWIQNSVISRIKVMAKLNIAEKRLPQDGRIEVKVGDQEIDVRISTLPTTFGERVVMRLLNKSESIFKLSEIGLARERLEILENIIKTPHGIILVTGPTGSGKTTTLYAILKTINTPDINIITIEDPVEYQIRGINQIQVNAKIDLTFARGLRSIVRQDPDVILIGEIRDKETADIAVQSALTGHLVFSTLHTNDSASAITRLVDIGVEPFLISSAVVAVAAQRLVRVLCDECKKPYQPDEIALNNVGLTLEQIHDHSLFKAQGCSACFHTGYKGRMAIIEIMQMNESLKQLILKTYDANLIRQEALNNQMVTLRQAGIQKVLDGHTTIEEVFRVTQQ